jgi:hypothetical protein
VVGNEPSLDLDAIARGLHAERCGPLPVKRILQDYEFHAAGRVWIVSEYHLTRCLDGTLGVSRTEFKRIHREIAWVLCQEDAALTDEAFEFLCDVADLFRGEYEGVEALGRGAAVKEKFKTWIFGDAPYEGDPIREKGK